MLHTPCESAARERAARADEGSTSSSQLATSQLECLGNHEACPEKPSSSRCSSSNGTRLPHSEPIRGRSASESDTKDTRDRVQKGRVLHTLGV